MEREIDIGGLGARIAALPGFESALAAAERAGVEAFLVGGAVRDALIGETRAELDLVVEGDQLALARELGGELREHERFATATVRTPAGEIDVARARTESYPAPGALPEIEPAGIEGDLARRDFSVNAIAVALRRPGEPLDPLGGIADLRAGFLRVLHPRSIADDPTRALRAARYAVRLGLEPEPATLAQIRAADLTTVSADRVVAEHAKLAAERDPRAAFELLAGWGLLALDSGAGERIDRIAALVASPPWGDEVERSSAVLAAIEPAVVARAQGLAQERPPSPSEAVAFAHGRPMTELALARALGGEWLDRFLTEWNRVELEIGGGDLLAAGVPEGTAIGHGLAAALRAKLDGHAHGREQELAVALDAVRSDR